MKKTTAIVALVAALSVSGCGNQKADSASAAADTNPGDVNTTSPSPALPNPQVTKGLLKGKELPLEKYLVSFSDSVSEQKAKVEAQRSCMARFGVTYSPRSPGKYPPPSDNTINIERRYGVADEDDAREVGYGVPNDLGEPPVDPELPSETNELLQGTLPNGKKLAKRNDKSVPPGGCEGEADTLIGFQEDGLAGELAGQSFVQSMSLPKVKAALAKWSGCMKSAGYHFANPMDIEAGDTKMAVHDVQCKKSTNLIDIWFKGESAIQMKMIQDNSEALETVRKKNGNTLEAAKNYSQKHG